MSKMSELLINCPHCGKDIKLTESLAAPLVQSIKKDYEQRLSKKELDIQARESTVQQQQAELTRAKESLNDQVEARLKTERAKIAEDEAKKARKILEVDIERNTKELGDLKQVLKERDAKLAEAQKAQAALIRKERELADAKREMDLTVEKRVQESLTAVRDQARREVEGGLKLKVAEKEETISSMQRQIEDLKRRAEQGSQQLQGEAQELVLESLLRTKFPHDTIEPVPKGEFGGDVIHRVVSPTGQTCGIILWESKRTKNWSDGWLPKLREDQRAAKADVALLISQVLPKNVETFDLIDNVWVTAPRFAVPVAMAVRQTLVEVSAARQATQGQQTKMELVYQYLTGARFRHRVAAIVEKFTDMQQDLEKERKTMTRLWAKREEQIRGVIESTAGMYGDLQGIAGQSIQEIEGLELKQLTSGKDEE